MPQIAGEYLVAVKLWSVDITAAPAHISGSPYAVTVRPGEISSAKSFTSINQADLLTFEAGITYLFSLQMVDIYGNLLIDGNAETEVEILATYENHSNWPSPIGIVDLENWSAIFGSNIAGIASSNNDGSYTCQVTIYRAGSFRLNVKINGWNVLNSPWPTLRVAPTNLYAPSCVPLLIPTTMVAGTQYQFLIQARDFYSNNMKLTLS